MSIERADNFIASLGIEAYRVGGSVRDELIGRTPKDADYMVRGIGLGDLLDVVQAQSRANRLSPLKLRDGQTVGWRVVFPGTAAVEITLPRREVSTGPKHSDFKIEVDPSITLEEDAQRRDFTFNALYKQVGDHILGFVKDPTGRGLYDLERRIVNTTHRTSFRDDPLRMLRALRFVARGYDMGGNTWAQMMEHAKSITGLTSNGHMSGTVYDEMCKILMGTDVRKALRIGRDTGVLRRLFPALAPMMGFDQASRYHDLTTDEHTFAALDVAAVSEASLRVRWALLFHDAGKPEAAWRGEDGRLHYYQHKYRPGSVDHEAVSERLWRATATHLSGIEREMVADVAKLIRYHMISYKSRGVDVRVRRMRVQFGPDLLYDLLMHRACDLAGKEGRAEQKHLDQVREMVRALNDANRDKIPAKITDLAINGRDLKDLGIEGRKIGEVLRAVLDEVVVRGDGLGLSRDWQLARAQAVA